MIKEFEKLTESEKSLLLKAPALVSFMAACHDHEISEASKADAIYLAHLKTFTADYRLLPYYQEVDKDFKKNFKETVSQYTPFDDVNREKLQQQIGKVSTVIAKLDKDFALVLHKSLAAYAEHVKQADMSILANFIFPLPIPGLTE